MVQCVKLSGNLGNMLTWYFRINKNNSHEVNVVDLIHIDQLDDGSRVAYEFWACQKFLRQFSACALAVKLVHILYA